MVYRKITEEQYNELKALRDPEPKAFELGILNFGDQLRGISKIGVVTKEDGHYLGLEFFGQGVD